MLYEMMDLNITQKKHLLSIDESLTLDIILSWKKYSCTLPLVETIYMYTRMSVVPKAPPHSSFYTGREAMNLKMVSDDRDHTSEAYVKVS